MGWHLLPYFLLYNRMSTSKMAQYQYEYHMYSFIKLNDGSFGCLIYFLCAQSHCIYEICVQVLHASETNHSSKKKKQTYIFAFWWHFSSFPSGFSQLTWEMFHSLFGFWKKNNNKFCVLYFPMTTYLCIHYISNVNSLNHKNLCNKNILWGKIV